MSQRGRKTVLFLCTGNYYRSRFAEVLFNSVAAKMGLPWQAASRGLALERGVNNVGSMAASAVLALEKSGIQCAEAISRMPLSASPLDFDRADRIVALQKAEHLPLLHERFPDWALKAECWDVEDDAQALDLIEREVMALVARILGGGERQGPPSPPDSPQPTPKETTNKPQSAKVGRETKGRRGKGVTTVFELPLNEAGLLELAALLKNRCGTGGTVKDGRIEIQGDQRERIVAELEKLGYRVKRVGG